MKRQIIAVASFAICLGALIWLANWQRVEPTFEGQTLSKWLEKADGRSLPGDDAALSNALRQMGPDALPFLIERLRIQPPRRSWIDNIQGRIGLYIFRTRPIRHDPHPDLLEGMTQEFDSVGGCVRLITSGGPSYNRKCQAIRAFRLLGAQALPALPQLTNLLYRTNTTAAAALALVVLGTEGQKALIPALKHREPYIRLCAAKSFHTFRHTNDAILAALAQSINDPEAKVRREIATILWLSRNKSLAVQSALIKGLADGDDTVSYFSACGIERFGPAAHGAAVPLVQLLERCPTTFQDYIYEALMAVDRRVAADAKYLPLLLVTLNKPDPEKQKAVLELLGMCGPSAAEALPQIVAASNHTNAEVRLAAAAAIAQISGPKEDRP